MVEVVVAAVEDVIAVVLRVDVAAREGIIESTIENIAATIEENLDMHKNSLLR